MKYCPLQLFSEPTISIVSEAEYLKACSCDDGKLLDIPEGRTGNITISSIPVLMPGCIVEEERTIDLNPPNVVQVNPNEYIITLIPSLVLSGSFFDHISEFHFKINSLFPLDNYNLTVQVNGPSGASVSTTDRNTTHFKICVPKCSKITTVTITDLDAELVAMSGLLYVALEEKTFCTTTTTREKAKYCPKQLVYSLIN